MKTKESNLKLKENADGTISCIVSVNRNRTPQEVLDATGMAQHISDSVVADMPKGEGDKVEVVFFKVGHKISDVDLDKEYARRGLVPADAYSQAVVNETDPAFTDDHANGTHWQDKDGNWCFLTFRRWPHERRVRVGMGEGDWGDGNWWFAGIRKT
jgi:hypothetical protein